MEFWHFVDHHPILARVLTFYLFVTSAFIGACIAEAAIKIVARALTYMKDRNRGS